MGVSPILNRSLFQKKATQKAKESFTCKKIKRHTFVYQQKGCSLHILETQTGLKLFSE